MAHFSTKTLVGCLTAAVGLGVATSANAVPFASAVSQSGNTVNFILNEPADTVTITRDGGNAIVINAAASGSHSFDMTGFSSWSIDVTHSQAAGWVESPSSVGNGNTFLEFERPRGVAVNRNPSSEHFGTLYVSHPRVSTTVSGRSMTAGIYVLNADGSDIDGTATPSAVVAKTAGLDFSGSTSSSPWRIEVGEDDTLYVGDWSDPGGGVKYTDPTVTTGGLLLDVAGDAGANAGGNHGSVVGTPVISGSLGSNLTLWTMDEDLEGSVAGTGNHIWRYDIGATGSDFSGAPTLVFDASTEGTNSDGSPIMLDLNIGVSADIYKDTVNDNWIITQPRSVGNETSLLIVGSDANGNPDATNILFNSRQFSIDNNLDGAGDDILQPLWDGIQDIFNRVSGAEVSPDGSTLFLHRRSATAGPGGPGENAYMGSGNVLIIPLDANGVPDLDLSDPIGNPSLGVVDIATHGSVGGSTAEITVDLAGNIYTATNIAEEVSIWGPGGNSTAITSSDGTFTINGVTYGGGGGCGLTGDLNCDGFVGIADLNIVLGFWNQNVTPGNKLEGDPSGDGFVGIDDLNTVLGNWNAGTPPTAGAVPEPATLALLGLGGLAMAQRRR